MGKAPGGRVFILASLNSNREKTEPKKSIIIGLSYIMQHEQIIVQKHTKNPGGGVFIFASLAEKTEKKPSPSGAFPENTL